MKKILLPTDFSKNAWNAIAYAVQFFKDEECLFYLLNTYTPVAYRIDYLVGGPAVSAIPDGGIDISLTGLEQTLAKIEKNYPNSKHHFETISEFNTLTDEVSSCCKKEGIDLIVMGTKGASGVKEIFLGSNTIHVIRKARVPVLAIPEGYQYRRVNSIIFPTDYEVSYDVKDMKLLFEIAKRNEATLHIVHAVEEELSRIKLEHKAQLKSMISSLNHKFQDVTDDYMPNIVHSYVEENRIDMVAMLNQKHTFLRRLLFRQNVDSIGYHCTIPFLVLPDTSKS
jgi:nucleotide-binding universal stress UspA family protein